MAENIRFIWIRFNIFIKYIIVGYNSGICWCITILYLNNIRVKYIHLRCEWNLNRWKSLWIVQAIFHNLKIIFNNEHVCVWTRVPLYYILKYILWHVISYGNLWVNLILFAVNDIRTTYLQWEWDMCILSDYHNLSINHTFQLKSSTINFKPL